MTYEAYLGYDRAQLLEKLQAKVSSKRLAHMLAVEETSKRLARQYGVDSEKAGLAGLLHDYAKECPDQVFLDIIDREGLDQDLKNWGNNVWHGLLGGYVIAAELGVTDQEILTSIARHTVGAAGMSQLDKIVYVADYIEPTRNFPGVEVARLLADQSLESAVAYETAKTIAYLTQKGLPIYPETLATYNAYCPYLPTDAY